MSSIFIDSRVVWLLVRFVFCVGLVFVMRFLKSVIICVCYVCRFSDLLVFSCLRWVSFWLVIFVMVVYVRGFWGFMVCMRLEWFLSGVWLCSISLVVIGLVRMLAIVILVFG